MTLSFFIFKPEITGRVVGETVYSELSVNETFSKSGELNLSFPGNLTSLSVSGSYSGRNVEIYLDDLLVFSSRSESLELTGNVVGDISRELLNISTEDNASNESIELNVNESNLTTNQSSQTDIKKELPWTSFSKECEDTCALDNFPLNATLRIIVKNATLNLSSITYSYISISKEDIISGDTSVTQNITVQENISYEEFNHTPVKVGEPVTWSRTVEDIDTVTLPGSAYNIQTDDEVTVKTADGELSIDEFSKLKAGKTKEIRLEIKNKGKVQISYQTPGPEKTEKEINKYKKQVTISSDIHYKDILASTEIEESPKEAITVYWLSDEGRKVVDDINYIDYNNNNLIDMLEWTVPHLSNQTYEISITVLNPYTYLSDGERWTVAFNTTGKANLTISSPNAHWTEFLTDNPDTFDEMEFLDIKCGDVSLNRELKLVGFDNSIYNYSGLTEEDSIDVEKLLIKDYECESTGYLENLMRKAGYATLMFEFENQNMTVRDWAYDPSSISLNNPPNNSTGISINPTLNVTVNDAESDPMNVTFYNRRAYLDAGDFFTCGLLQNGSAMCWGKNEDGQLGIGTKVLGMTSPVLVKAPALTYIGTGLHHACGILDNGTVLCWGRNIDGELGLGYSGSDVSTPTRINSTGRFVSIGAGFNFSCGLLENGSAMCWGSNGWGQIGGGPGLAGRIKNPVNINTSNVFVTISVGSRHTCGLLTNGSIMCWGGNIVGQTGIGSDSPTTVYNPSYVNTTRQFVGVAAGLEHTCGLLTNGSIMCWGANWHGQLGTGDDSPMVIFKPTYANHTSPFNYVDCGYGQTCGILYNGTALCWGHNQYNKTGTGCGQPYEIHNPTRVNTTARFVAISGNSQTCGILINGSMMCWGLNQAGETGIGYSNSWYGICEPSYVNTSNPFFNITMKIGNQTDISSGSHAEIVWSNLLYSKTYLWSVTADDGTGIMNSQTWQFKTEGVPPEITSPTFSPPVAYTDDNIDCNATPTDAENYTLTVEWFWYNSTAGILASGNNTGLANGDNSIISTLGAGNTTENKAYNCSVRSFDGEKYSEWKSSIINITVYFAPEITSPTFSPTTAYTSDNINCNATPTDAENDTLTVEWFWYNSTGGVAFSGNKTNVSNGTNTVISTLGSGNTSVGETWNCTVRTYDGELYSDWDSAEINITEYYAPAIINATDNASTINVGDKIKFTSHWSHANSGQNIRLLIANNSDFSNCNYSEQSGCLAYSSPDSTSPTEAEYTAQSGDGNIEWYAQVCDEQGACDRAQYIYDYTNSSHKAYEKNGTASSPSDYDNEANTTEYEYLNESDDNRWVTSFADETGEYDTQIFVFNLTSNTPGILNITWEGYGETESGYNTTLHAWDYNGNQWVELASVDFNSSTDQNLTHSETGDPGKFINDTDGEVVMMAKTKKYVFSCGDNITFTYNGSEVTYGTVEGQNSTCWMDRNLGASQVATARNDANAYGDLFQWGRLDDGHQERTSGTTSTNSNGDDPGHSDFIVESNSPYDWRDPQNDNLWQGVNGTNNPCPEGWRIPTETELDNERSSWSSNNYNGAFDSPLKWSAAGYRSHTSGSLFSFGSSGYYWSSTVVGTNARFLYFQSSTAYVSSFYRAYGFSVRCIKDSNSPYIYTYENDQYTFLSDFVGGATSKSKEYLDFTDITHTEIEDGKVKLKITEELNETAYIDRIYLRVDESEIVELSSITDANISLLSESDDNYLVMGHGAEHYLEFPTPENYKKLEFAAEGYYIKHYKKHNSLYTDYIKLETYAGGSFDVNEAPEITTPTFSPTTAYTDNDISCNATPTDGENSTLTIEWFWYNGTDEMLSDNTTGLTENVNAVISTLGSGNTTKGETWNCTVRTFDGELYSDYSSAEITIQNSPPTINLLTPINGNESIRDRTPEFTWSGIDDDSDTLNYTIWISENSDLTSPLIDAETQDQNYTPTTNLELDTDYFWRVQASDGESYTNSSIWNFTTESYIEVKFINESIDFGSMNLSETKNTTSDEPYPFVLQNMGNVLVNVTFGVTGAFWDSALASLDTRFMQFKADNRTTPNAFDFSNSQTTWMNLSTENKTLVKELNYSDSNDEVVVDILIRVPEDEPVGSKSTTFVIEIQ